MRMTVGKVVLQCLTGDISKQSDVEAIVNSANLRLVSGGGITGDVHAAAGPELEKACRPFSPLEPGEVALTRGFSLPNKFVIHVRTPVFDGNPRAAEMLAHCYARALEAAESQSIASMAFPALATGWNRFPVESAAQVAWRTVASLAPELKHIRLVRFVLKKQAAFDIYCSELIRAVAMLTDPKYKLSVPG